MIRRPQLRFQAAALVSVICVMFSASCQRPMSFQNRSSSQRDINAVLASHDHQLLSIPGVVGVYVGLLDDQKTECLKVMLARRDPETEKSIPRLIEGYPVII